MRGQNPIISLATTLDAFPLRAFPILPFYNNLNFMRKMQKFYIQLEEEVMLVENANGKVCLEFEIFK